MNPDYKTCLKEVMKHNPPAVLCGSSALSLMGLLKRNPKDIDIIVPVGYKFVCPESENFKSETVDSMVTDDVSSAYRIMVASGSFFNSSLHIKVDVFEMESRVEVAEISLNGQSIKCQKPEGIIKKKEEYAKKGVVKHQEDLGEIKRKLILQRIR